jgi:hypothetical protein
MGLGDKYHGVQLVNLKTHILPIRRFMHPNVLPHHTPHCIHNPEQTKLDTDLLCSKAPSQCTTLPMRDRYVGALRNMMPYRYIYCNHYYGTG